MELAWRARLTDSVMPFMIQYMRDTSKRIASLEAKLAPKEEEHAAAAAGGMAAPGMGGMGMVRARAGLPFEGRKNATPPPVNASGNKTLTPNPSQLDPSPRSS